MAAVIGLRVYRIFIHKRGTRTQTAFDSNSISHHPRIFVENFFDKYSSPTQEEIAERSWYIERNDLESNIVQGYIRYGTYGFESNLIDAKTKKKKYKRTTTDVEEIPLFLRFWFPEKQNFALAAFQSFQGRSCIALLARKMREEFEISNREYVFSFNKLTPANLKGTTFYSAPIKRVRFVSRKVSSDLADKYLSDAKNELIDVEYSLTARRKRNLGALSSFMSRFSDEKRGVIEHEGIDFTEAYAEVKIGNKLRRIGVFGPNSDAGVIDISDNIKMGSDGHPTLESLKQETGIILQDFCGALIRGVQ